MYGILEENGPCYANPDSNSTRPAEWSWNRKCMSWFDLSSVRSLTECSEYAVPRPAGTGWLVGDFISIMNHEANGF